MKLKNIFYILLACLLITSKAFSIQPTDSTTLDASLHPSGYTSNLTLDSTKTYVLKGYLFIQSGATIRIPAGTLIRGDQGTKGCLIINRGATINAIGTASRPIIFTSRNAPGLRAAGDWGGVIIVGKATINTYTGADTNIVEGVVPDLYYGGHNDADNSGVLQYCRIEYGGVALSPNNEINGLSLYSCGTGTTMDHIMVSYAGDDSFEWFGGTINMKYLITWNGLDDDFDDSYGFRGKVQFGLCLRTPGIADVSGSKQWESDNNEFASGSSTIFNPQNPRTKSIFCNVTSIGPKEFDTTTISPLFTAAIHERRWSLRNGYNSIWMGWNRGYYLDHIGCINAAAGDTIKFISNILAGISGANFDTVRSNGSFNPTFWGMDPLKKNDTLFLNTQVQLLNPYSTSRTDANFFPQSTNSIVYSNVTDPATIDPFFTSVNYRGAFGFGGADWGAGWTNWRPDTVDYNNYVNPIGIQPISNIVPVHFNLYQNYPNPFNPQTTIKFDITNSGLVTLKIYDILGREVNILANNETVNAGTYKVDFNASELPSGIYFYKLTVNSSKNVWTETKKMILVK